MKFGETLIDLRKRNGLTQEELAAKRHNFELEKCGSSVVCIDSRMAGVGSNACGPALDDKYRLPLPEISAKFRIEISTKEKH